MLTDSAHAKRFLMPSIPDRYTKPAIILHWVIAVLMVLNVILGLSAENVRDEWVRPIVDTHKSIGITLLGLAILRLLWRATHEPPAMPQGYGRLERVAAHLAHWALYGVMFLLPLSGWMHDSAWKDAATHPMQYFGLFEWPRIGWIMAIEPLSKEGLHDLFGAVHLWLGNLLYVLFALHVLGALKHQILDREKELQRMLP